MFYIYIYEMKKFYLPFVLFLFFAFPYDSISQNRSKADELLTNSIRAFKRNDVKKSIELLEKALQFDPFHFQANIVYGDISFELDDYKKSSKYYIKADSIKESTFLKYKIAQSFFYQGNYGDAKVLYLEYLKRKDATSKFIQKAKKRIKSCDFALESIKQPVEFNPINIGEAINTSGFEYNPVLSADGKSLIYTVIREKNGRKVEDLFISYFNDTTWTQGVALPGFINSRENEGAHVVSMDGDVLFFTSCGRLDGYGSCDLYYSFKVNDLWSKPVNMGPRVNSNYWDAHPSISPDGNLMVFSSARPGGKGGKDLWAMRLDNGRWLAPYPLNELNTTDDEVTPFLHADGKTMYFSSDGHLGMGNRDFFKTTFNDSTKSWTKPINLGYKINSPGDEYSLSVSRDGSKAFFANDRIEGYGNMDIFYFELDQKIRASKTAFLQGKIIDSLQNKLIEDSKIEFYDLDSKKKKLSFSLRSGKYKALLPSDNNYAAIVKAPGYKLLSETFYFKEDSINNYVKKDFYLSLISKSGTIDLNNIFFKSGDYKLLDESLFELDLLIEFLVENGDLKIKIIGHTDSIGSEKDNNKLSKNRAKSVAAYLIKSGIDSSRVSTDGKGESSPIKSNDTEEGRRKNRRTEIFYF
jgi:outer membrane protein OmpA-like peptidoglycan-associated protein/tetratricopeptide (TPR) repeat protein